MYEETTGSANPRKGNIAIPILFAFVLALLAASVTSFVRLDGLKKDMAAIRQSIDTEFANVKESAMLGDTSSRESMEALRKELETTRQQASATAG